MTDADSPQPPAAPAETLPATDLEALRAAHAARPPTTPRERLRWALRFVEAGDLETARALRAALPADDAARLDRALLADAPGAPTEEDAAEAEADALDLRRAPLERQGAVAVLRHRRGASLYGVCHISVCHICTRRLA